MRNLGEIVLLVFSRKNFLAAGFVTIFVGLFFFLATPDFIFTLPHERDLYRALGERILESALLGPEVKPGDRIWGGGYYFLLRLSALFSENWLEGSAFLAVALHGFFLGLLMRVGLSKEASLSSALFPPLLFLFSLFATANLFHLWNPSFLPLFLGISILSGRLAQESTRGNRFIFLTLAGASLAMATQIHASALALAIAAAIILGKRVFLGLTPAKRNLLMPLVFAALILAGLFSADVLAARVGSFWALIGHLKWSAASFPLQGSYGLAMILKHCFDLAGLVLVYLALRSSRESTEASSFWQEWVRCSIFLSMIPALYAWLWFFSSPNNFKDRYWIALLSISVTFLSANSVRQLPIWIARASWIVGFFVSMVIITQAPGAVSWSWISIGALGSALWLAAFFYDRAAGLSRQEREKFMILCGCLFLFLARSSSGGLFFREKPLGKFLNLAQGKSLVGFIKKETNFEWVDLSRSLFLVGFQSNSAFGNFYENINDFNRPARLDDLVRTGVIIAPSGRSVASTQPENSDTCTRWLGEIWPQHNYLKNLYFSGLLEVGPCWDGGRGVAAFIFNHAGNRAPALLSVGNYGSQAHEIFSNKNCRKSGESCPSFKIAPSPQNPKSDLILEFGGIAFGDRDSDRTHRSHFTNLRLTYRCEDGQEPELPLVLESTRTRYNGKTFIPGYWSVMTNDQIYAPVRWLITNPCRADPVEILVSWDEEIVLDQKFAEQETKAGQRIQLYRRER